MPTIRLRVRTPQASAPQDMTVDEDAPWIGVLYELEALSGISVEKLRVLSGYPPKAMDYPEETCVKDLKIRNNDMLIVQEGPAKVMGGEQSGQKYVPPASERAHFTRRICPGDNSCLFHACAYVLRDRSRSDGPLLRQQCVDVVRSRPDVYNENTLAMSNEAYRSWLSRPDSWGGGVELQILSETYQTEIFALDLESTTVQRFGTDQNYSVRAFVVYTGNHYDCIAMNPQYNSSSEKDDQVLFNTRDDAVFARAQRFVKEEGEKLKKK